MAPGARRKYTSAGHRLKVYSPRLQLFRLKGPDCIACGLMGAFFVLESVGSENPHLNLYGVKLDPACEAGASGRRFGADPAGLFAECSCREFLMTKDHIFPKSKGGKDIMDNFQPMCAKCNGEKADKI